MSIDLEEFQQLQEKIKQDQTEKDKAVGALEQLKQRLVDEYNCHSVREAVELLNQLKKELGDVKEEYQETLQILKEEYPLA